MKKRPNILWIQTDEQRPDSLGCYGSEWARTPNIDRLAERGVCCRECHVQSPVCVPSRISMLSCRYPHEINVFGNRVHYQDGVLDPELMTFPQILAREGYRTASIGKWHTPNHPTWQENVHIENFMDRAGFYAFADPSLEESHGVIKRVGSSPIILAGTYPDDGSGTTPSSHITDLGIEWLAEAAKRDEPFLLRVSHLWPHTPVLAPAPWDKLYDPEEVTCRSLNRGMYENRSVYERTRAHRQRGFDMPLETWKRICACYYGLIAHVDDQVGRLLDALENLGLAGNTIVAFNADHGKSMGEYGACEKGTFDREVWRVPFFISWPRHLPEREVRHDICELIDFAPTLFSLAGLEPGPGMHGRDLFNAGEAEAVFGVIGWGETHDPSAPDAPDREDIRRAAARTRKWRYDCTVRFDGRDTLPDEYDGTLIDIENDPFELENLVPRPELAPVVQELHGKIEQWLAS